MTLIQIRSIPLVNICSRCWGSKNLQIQSASHIIFQVLFGDCFFVEQRRKIAQFTDGQLVRQWVRGTVDFGEALCYSRVQGIVPLIRFELKRLIIFKQYCEKLLRNERWFVMIQTAINLTSYHRLSLCKSWECNSKRRKCQHQIGCCHLAVLNPVDLKSLCLMTLCFLSHSEDDL